MRVFWALKIPGLDRWDVFETGDISYVRLKSNDFSVVRYGSFRPRFIALAGPSFLKVFASRGKGGAVFRER